MNNPRPVCGFCESNELSLKYGHLFHPVKKDHGPFDMYECKECRSLITWPLPLKDQLATLYSSFGDGMIPLIRDIRESDPLTIWYQQCITRATSRMNILPQENTEFSWIDIGAGGGELAKMMALQFPRSKGVAVDFHTCPAILRGIDNVTWISYDLNGDFAEKINLKFDLVVSITVIEHVLDPYNFLKNAGRLVKEQGSLYLTAPCADTLASKVLGKKWPYIIPGEHLNISSVKGMVSLLQRLQTEPMQKRAMPEAYARKTILPYTLGYFLAFCHLSFLKKVMPHSFPINLPTGILEAGYGFNKK
jgi:SAM-dependent methyltransferase